MLLTIKETVDVVPAIDQDAETMWEPLGCLLGEVFWACPTRRRLHGRPISLRWLENSSMFLQYELRKVAREREVWASLHKLVLP